MEALNVDVDLNWYRALPLTERAALLNDGVPYTTEGNKRFQKWRDDTAFKQDAAALGERLEIEDLTEDRFRQVLSLPLETLSKTETPSWLIDLFNAFDQAGQSDPLTFFAHNTEDSVEQTQFVFLNLVEPVVRQARTRVLQHLESLESDDLPIDPKPLVGMLIEGLLNYLVGYCLTRTLVLELNVARLSNQIESPTPEQGFLNFVEKLRDPDFALSILHEYPVLARQVMIAVQYWVDNSIEFADRLCADWDDIKATFSPDQDPGKLTHFQSSAGDRHRTGHSVHILGFNSGLKLVYKPRSLAIDCHFQDLLVWLNEHSDLPPFRTLTILDHHTHGWIEFVEAAGCSSPEQLQRFYERQGGYLALLYAMRAVDFHFENLIASGEHPILIDLESLFHTLSAGLVVRESKLELSLGRAIQHSVLTIGLLPQRIWGNEEVNGIDMSGLSGHGGQLTPDKVPTYDQVGTATMHFTRKRIVMPGSNNRPTLNDQDVNVQEYAGSIVKGFTTVYRLLLDRRHELLAKDGAITRFANDEIRIIPRATRTYGLMLYESFHPDLLRDTLDRDRFFDRLWIAGKQLPFLKRLFRAERRDLWRGDIPLFTTYPGSRDLWTSDQERIPDFADVSGLETVRDHMLGLNLDDLEKQTWFIQASMATLSMGVGKSHWPTYKPIETPMMADSQSLVDAARQIGDRLELLALKDEGEASWIGLLLVNEKNWALLPLGFDFYNGVSGVVLFLAHLGERVGEQRYTHLAQEGLNTILRTLNQTPLEKMPLGGAFDGLGATIYVLTHLGVLWQRSDLLERAESLVSYISPLIEADKQLDIIGGTAGVMAVLLALYEHRPSLEVLNTAIACGDHLIRQSAPMEHGRGWPTSMSDRPLAGFSHGAAGFAWALAKLSTVTGESRFLKTALEALEYERSLFSEENHNWPDLRDLDYERLIDDPAILEAYQKQIDANKEQYMHAWCHGAPGVGISRVGMLEVVDDADIRNEIDIAIQATLTQGFGMNHSVCHGDLGNLELILLASHRHNPALHNTVYNKAAAILNSIEQCGWLCGVPNGVETPGFMTGLSGIGYQLLRLSDPDQVPSVLLLESPRRR